MAGARGGGPDATRLSRRAFLGATTTTGAALATAALAAGTAGCSSPDPEGSSSGGSDAGGPLHPGPPVQGQPAGLMANAMDVALGVDPDDLVFAWQLTDDRRDALQRAYSIVVSSVTDRARPVWRSGRVRSPQQSGVVYAGPRLSGGALYEWTVSVADAGGTWGPASHPQRFVTTLRDEDWTASWLRPGPTPPITDQYRYLRHAFSLPAGTVRHATAYVATAHKVQLWCNGNFIDSATSFCYPMEQYVQATDLTTVIRPAHPNAVGVLHHWYGAGKGRPASSPGLLLELVVLYADGRRVTVGTGGDWRELPAEWDPSPERNDDGVDYVELVDERHHPEGWTEADYDDAAWPAATVLGPVGAPAVPFGGLRAQRTRIATVTVPAVSVTTLPGGEVVADFGRVIAAKPKVVFAHPAAGRRLPMRLGFALDPDGRVSTTHATQDTDMTDSLVQGSTTRAFEPYAYLGFQYFEMDGAGERLDRSSVWAVARRCAMPPGLPAQFSSSNAMLDRVWAMCSHSALSCSQEQFVDTPTRSKGQFLWDAANESEGVMLVYGDQNLSWQALHDFANSQAQYWPDGRLNAVYPNGDGARDFPDFTARYPEWVWRYLEATGDVRTVVQLYPVVARVVDYLWGYLDATTGLVTGPVLTASPDWDYGYDYDTVADTTVNSLAVNAALRLSQMATLAGDPSAAAAASSRAGALVSAVDAHLTTPQGLYVDGLRGDGTQSPSSSQQANIVALAYGVVPPTRVATVGAYVSSLDMSVEPNHGLELMRALAAAGRYADMVRILTDPSFPGYAAIVAAGGSFTWECWRPSDIIGDSMSHGWGSSVLVAMVESLLGLVRLAPTAAGPGGPIFDLIPPPAGVLDFAQASVPTRAGPLAYGWDRRGGPLQVSVRLPPNAAARLHVAGPAASVTESGRVVGSATSGVSVDTDTPTASIVRIGAGDYHLTVAT